MEGIEPVAQMVSSLGVAGVLGWFLYYKTAIADPRRDENTLSRIDKMQTQNNQVLERVCTDFTAALREERETQRAELAALRAEFKMIDCQRNRNSG